MSHDRDIDPILDAWLAPGPETMPDRLFDDVLDRVARTPQLRARHTTARYTTMLSAFKAPLAASLAALVIGLAAVVWWDAPDRYAPGATSPQPSPSLGPSAGPPADLVTGWVGPPRHIAELQPSEYVALWAIYSNGLFQLDQAGQPLRSRVVAIAPGEIRLTSSADGPAGCERGTVGTYRYDLSDDGQKVTFEAIDEDCSFRQDFLTGTWSSQRCELGAPCLGTLAPGQHESAAFDARNGAGSIPKARPGGLAFEVPDGWANDWDHLSSLRLVPVEVYREEERVGSYPKNVWPDQISVWSRPVALAEDPRECTWREDPDGGSTADSLAAWLRSHPELAASEPVETDLDGHRALVVDIDIAPGAGLTCGAMGGGPFVPLFASRDAFGADGSLVGWGEGAWEVDGWTLGSGDICAECISDPQRLVLVDLDGQPVVILVDSARAEDQAAWIERAMPIVESFQFPE